MFVMKMCSILLVLYELKPFGALIIVLQPKISMKSEKTIQLFSLFLHFRFHRIGKAISHVTRIDLARFLRFFRIESHCVQYFYDYDLE